MEADCIIHSAGASECVGNRMYDGWPRWRSSPLRWAVHLFICLFIYSLIQRDAKKLWSCFKAAAAAGAAAEECLAALANAPTPSLSSGWLRLKRHLGQDFTIQRCLSPHIRCLCKSEPPSVLFIYLTSTPQEQVLKVIVRVILKVKQLQHISAHHTSVAMLFG